MEYELECLGAEEKEPKHYVVVLSNGIEIDVYKDAKREDTMWAWLVDEQYFDGDDSAIRYLRKLIAEKVTRIRLIYHKRREIPDICGENGCGCRCPDTCNSLLCSDCPIAEKTFADKDKVTLVYVV